jgi:hypothetical protein
MRLPERRLFAIASLALVLTAACAQAAPPKVDIESLQSDIVFGAKPKTRGTSKNTGGIAVVQPPQPTLAPLLPPTSVRPPPPAPVGDCPEAKITDFPEEAASTNIDEPPTTGAYRWKRDGEITVDGDKVQLDGFDRRLVRRVEEQSGGPLAAEGAQTYTFQTVQPYGQMQLHTDWRVRTGSPTGDPEKGVSLLAMRLQDAAGEVVFSFEPSIGLLYFPLPVSPGAAFSSSAIDASSGQRWDLAGTVTKRERIDACGDVVEGWGVQADVTFSGVRSGTQEFHYIVATQLGGVLIAESSKGESHVGGPAASDFTLGQLQPSALEGAEK